MFVEEALMKYSPVASLLFPSRCVATAPEVQRGDGVRAASNLDFAPALKSETKEKGAESAPTATEHR